MVAWREDRDFSQKPEAQRMADQRRKRRQVFKVDFAQWLSRRQALPAQTDCVCVSGKDSTTLLLTLYKLTAISWF